MRRGQMSFALISTDITTLAGYDSLPAPNITNLTCRDDFFISNFSCLPHCHRWDQRPQNVIAEIEDIVHAIAVILFVLLCSLFLVTIFIRRQVL